MKIVKSLDEKILDYANQREVEDEIANAGNFNSTAIDARDHAELILSN